DRRGVSANVGPRRERSVSMTQFDYGRRPRGPRPSQNSAPGTQTPDLRELPPEERARQLCLGALERRMRSRKQLAQLLQRKRIPSEISVAVLDRLQEVGLINDEAYARAFVASRQRTRPRGNRGLSSELWAKGIAPDVIHRVLDESEEVEDPVATARRALEPKLRQLAGKPVDERKRKAEQFLLRRGFSYEVIRTVLGETADD
ncbi:MAG TPA: regulatory protein RecX, partial [Candidatus Eisenbacteria bacterium]|nr:regulatory protein RecX [Candidatus Eisenbacteria bacterium]